MPIRRQNNNRRFERVITPSQDVELTEDAPTYKDCIDDAVALVKYQLSCLRKKTLELDEHGKQTELTTNQMVQVKMAVETLSLCGKQEREMRKDASATVSNLTDTEVRREAVKAVLEDEGMKQLVIQELLLENKE